MDYSRIDRDSEYERHVHSIKACQIIRKDEQNRKITLAIDMGGKTGIQEWKTNDYYGLKVGDFLDCAVLANFRDGYVTSSKIVFIGATPERFIPKAEDKP